jgi:hypothetical protein
MEYATGWIVICGAFLYCSLLGVATGTDTVQQAMPVGIVSSRNQSAAFEAVSIRQLGIGATGQMPGQRP